jgi:DNA-binding NtrC family response regulator
MQAPRARILIIDDDIDLLETLDQLISDTYDTKAVSDAREALKLLLIGENFQVIMCDLMMPHMGGVEFYQQIQLERPDLCSRILFLSGGSFTQKTTEFLKTPGIQSCEKPIQVELLLERMEKIIELHRGQPKPLVS